MMSLSRLVHAHAARTPDATAIVFEGERTSYAALSGRVRRLASGLVDRGVRVGDVVATLMKNSAAFLELALATSEVGAVFLPINFRLSEEEVSYITNNAGALLLFVDSELVINAPAGLNRVVVDEQARRDGSALLPPGDTYTAASCSPSDLFRLMYTSGTTDRPKGVMHSYANYYYKTADHIALLGLTAATRLLVAGPLYHVGAFDLPGTAVLWVGGTMVVLRDFDADAVLETIEREAITGAWLAPVMTTMLLARRASHFDVDVSSLRWVIGGGERTPESRIREFATLFTRARYIDAFGMTETCSGDTFMVAGREIEKIGSTGLPVPLLDLSIRDEAGAALPPCVEGELCLRGPKVTRGYYKDPGQTKSAYFADWFRTGDIGYLDDDGFLFLTDRKKDMIISGGENIASSEVERVLLMLGEVHEAAVIGLPDSRWGERPIAVVVRAEGAMISEADVIAHCRATLAKFKVPRQVVFAEVLPRNPSGKVIKRVLREQLARGKF